MDDARLVVVNALSAQKSGADIRTRTRCTRVQRQTDLATWRVELEDMHTRSSQTVHAHFTQTLSRNDIVGSFSGVRALCDDESTDPSAMTRDYTLELSSERNRLPLLSIFGGKITTYRKLAESVMASLKPWFPDMGDPWTQSKPLPGSARHLKSLQEIRDLLAEIYPLMPEKLLHRFARSYGTLTLRILGNAQTFEALGQHFGADLTEREVDYLIQHEWAQTVDDILWRRTKLAIRMKPQQRHALEAYVTARHWNKRPEENPAVGLERRAS